MDIEKHITKISLSIIVLCIILMFFIHFYYPSLEIIDYSPRVVKQNQTQNFWYSQEDYNYHSIFKTNHINNNLDSFTGIKVNNLNGSSEIIVGFNYKF